MKIYTVDGRGWINVDWLKVQDWGVICEGVNEIPFVTNMAGTKDPVERWRLNWNAIRRVEVAAKEWDGLDGRLLERTAVTCSSLSEEKEA